MEAILHLPWAVSLDSAFSCSSYWCSTPGQWGREGVEKVSWQKPVYACRSSTPWTLHAILSPLQGSADLSYSALVLSLLLLPLLSDLAGCQEERGVWAMTVDRRL